MRLRCLAFSLLAAASTVGAFTVPTAGKPLPSTRSSLLDSSLMAAATEDCGCEEVIMAGKPTDMAKSVNAREVIGKHSVFSAKGEQVSLNELVGDGVSIVVFLRSLG